MRGWIIRWDDQAGSGEIKGSDHRVYVFARPDLKNVSGFFNYGQPVDFDTNGTNASDIYLLMAQPTFAMPQYGTASPAMTQAPSYPPNPAARPVEFLDAIKIGWAKSFKPFGRARRSEYWWFYLFMYGVSYAFGLVAMAFVFPAMMANIDDIETMSDPFALMASPIFRPYWIASGLTFVLAPAMICVWVRRMHDVGFHAWPFVAAIIGCVAGMTYGSWPMLSKLFEAAANGTVFDTSAFGTPPVYVWVLFAIYFIAGIWAFILTILPGQRKDNRFGPDPKAPPVTLEEEVPVAQL
jgi:uncharacterized membrane protein YhaH (DUF805 family)